MSMRGSATGNAAPAMAWAALRRRFRKTCSISVSVQLTAGSPSAMSTRTSIFLKS